MRWFTLLSLNAAIVLVCAGCALRFAPGSVRPARLLSSDPAGYEPLEVAYVPFGVKLGEIVYATDERALGKLWRRLGLDGVAPTIDFGAYVVFGWVHSDDACFEEVTAIELTTDGHLRPKLGNDVSWCEMPLRTTAHVVAVARASLPKEGAVIQPWRKPTAPTKTLRFSSLPAPRAPRVTADPAAWTSDRAVRGEADLPPPGKTIGVALDDATPVWIVRHRDGGVDVLASDLAPAGGVHGIVGLRAFARWSPVSRRFNGGGRWDEYGVAVYRRDPPLDRYEHQVLPGERIRIGRRVGGTARRTVEPLLDDVAAESESVRLPVQSFSVEQALAQPDGALVMVEAGLVCAGGQPLRICPPKHEAPCTDQAPIPLGLSHPACGLHEGTEWPGLLLARVRGGRLADVVLMSDRVYTY